MAKSLSGIIAGRAFIVLEAVDRTPRVLRRVQANFLRFGAQIQSMGANIVTRGLLAATPAAVSLKIFADFDDAMRKVEARSAGTAEAMREIRVQARLLGRTTAFTARQIGGLQAILAQRGFRREQILQMTPNIMNLARAAGTGNREQDILVAADVVSGAIRAFKMDAGESAHVADLLTAAVNNSNFSLEDLQVSMANAGSIAKMFNTNLQEVLATLATMRDVNIDPSVAGTGLRNIFLKASNARRRDEFNKQLQQMTGSTIKFIDELGNLESPSNILFSIFELLEKSNVGTAARGDIFAELFGLRAIIPATALAQGRERFQELMKEMDRAADLAAVTAKKMDAGVGGSFRILVSATEGLANALGLSLSGAVSTLSKVITKIQNDLEGWIAKNTMLVNKVHLLIAVTILLGGVLFATGIAIKFVAFALGPFIAMIGFAILAVKLFIASLVLLFTVLTAHWVILLVIIPLLIVLVIKFFVKIAQGAQAAAAFVGGILSSVFERLKEILETLGTTWEGVTSALMSGRVEQAWAIAMEGMTLAWLQFKDAVIDGANEILKAVKILGLQMFIALNKINLINPAVRSDQRRQAQLAEDLMLLRIRQIQAGTIRGVPNFAADAAGRGRQAEIDRLGGKLQARVNFEIFRDFLDSLNIGENMLRGAFFAQDLLDDLFPGMRETLTRLLLGPNRLFKNLVQEGAATATGAKSSALEGLQANSMKESIEFYKDQANLQDGILSVEQEQLEVQKNIHGELKDGIINVGVL